jgi:transaldolase
MPTLHEVSDLGQSIWMDFIDREFIESGKLQELIDQGIRGVTSNPSIFHEAISEGNDYDQAIGDLVASGYSSGVAVYEALAIEDIRQTAELLRPLYDETEGVDGFISLEADPELAYDTEETIEEVRRLFQEVDRPNVMIKVPATSAGIPAIAALIGEGININVILMFSLRDYEAVSAAYLLGLERYLDSGGDVSQVASVASFFVSRVDTAVDKKLAQIKGEAARSLQGRIGIANAKMAYLRYLQLFSSQRWQRLAAQGARPQRILYGSTSVKNPDYPDTMYVDELIGANTINTVPLDAIEAFREHGTASPTLTTKLEEARQQLVQLGQLGIDLERITQQLQDDGVAKFADAFEQLLLAIDEQCESCQKRERQP